jgi:hypothetical protein
LQRSFALRSYQYKLRISGAKAVGLQDTDDGGIAVRAMRTTNFVGDTSTRQIATAFRRKVAGKLSINSLHFKYRVVKNDYVKTQPQTNLKRNF